MVRGAAALRSVIAPPVEHSLGAVVPTDRDVQATPAGALVIGRHYIN